MDIKFSIHRYDKDGDAYERGVYLEIGNVSVRVGEGVGAIDDLIEQLKSIREEIIENYPDVADR